MGLDIDIYKLNNKGEKELVQAVGNSYWFLLTYIENILGREWPLEYQMPVEQAKDLVERCCDVLLNYFNSPRKGWDKFVEKAKELLPISSVADDERYDDDYATAVFLTSNTFFKLYKELSEEESIWIEISY